MARVRTYLQANTFSSDDSSTAVLKSGELVENTYCYYMEVRYPEYGEVYGRWECESWYVYSPITEDQAGDQSSGGGESSGDWYDESPDGRGGGESTVSSPEVIIDPTFENTKAECVYGKLENTSFLNNLQSAFKLSEKYDLTYKVVANLPAGEAGVIPNAVHKYNLSSNTSIISINAFYFDKEAPVSLAKTILHETIHAKISQKIDQAGGFEEFENAGFEERIKAYYKHYISSNLADHNIIADFYITEMGKALAGYDGNKYPLSYYEALSWHGLYSTTAWNSLSQDKRNQIRNIWDIINSGVKQCK